MQVFVWFEVASQVCDGLRIDHGEEEITPLFCKKTRLTLNVSPAEQASFCFSPFVPVTSRNVSHYLEI